MPEKSLASLILQIERQRRQMIQAAERLGRNHPDVLARSQKLDRLVVVRQLQMAGERGGRLA